MNFNNELEVCKESGGENDNAETEREKNTKKTKEIIYIKVGSDDDERHKKEQTKNMTEGKQIEVEGKINTIRKKIIHYYDLSSEDNSRLSGEQAELQKKQE